MMAITAREYPVLRDWFAVVFEECADKRFLTPQNHPLRLMAEVEERWPARARSGLEMAINDTIEETENLPPERVLQVDSRLAQQGLPTLSEMRVRFSKKLRRILKRGAIKNDEEYYLLQNAFDFVEEDQQVQISRLFADYETGVIRRA